MLASSINSMSIEDEVLNHKYDVEENWHDREHEFDNVERVVTEERLASSYWVNDLLSQREGTASEIKDDVTHWPALCALSLEIEVNLVKAQKSLILTWGIYLKKEMVALQ